MFDAISSEIPSDAIATSAQLYVLRRAKPKHQPLYLICDGTPPAAFRHLGNRPVKLAFQLPTAFKTSPRACEDALPAWATWRYAVERVKLDLATEPPAFRSKLFPGWKTVDPRALRGIEAALTRFAAVKPATEAALRRCVVATNKYENEIHTTEAEELYAQLIRLATQNQLARKRAIAVIEAERAW